MTHWKNACKLSLYRKNTAKAAFCETAFDEEYITTVPTNVADAYAFIALNYYEKYEFECIHKYVWY